MASSNISIKSSKVVIYNVKFTVTQSLSRTFFSLYLRHGQKQFFLFSFAFHSYEIRNRKAKTNWNSLLVLSTPNAFNFSFFSSVGKFNCYSFWYEHHVLICLISLLLQVGQSLVIYCQACLTTVKSQRCFLQPNMHGTSYKSPFK